MVFLYKIYFENILLSSFHLGSTCLMFLKIIYLFFCTEENKEENKSLSLEDLRNKRLAYLDKKNP